MLSVIVQGFLLSKPNFDFFVLYILLLQYLPIISLKDLQDFEDPIKDCNRDIYYDLQYSCQNLQGSFNQNFEDHCTDNPLVKLLTDSFSYKSRDLAQPWYLGVNFT